MTKTIEQVLLDRILFIGDSNDAISALKVDDERPISIFLGSPKEIMDELKKSQESN